VRIINLLKIIAFIFVIAIVIWFVWDCIGSDAIVSRFSVGSLIHDFDINSGGGILLAQQIICLP
jgi:hypothetical protein